MRLDSRLTAWLGWTRTVDGHRVALGPATVAPAVLHPVAPEQGPQPGLMLQVRHLCLLVSAGHCNDRQAGLFRARLTPN